jgi:multidrug efflux system membrane fusion protein
MATVTNWDEYPGHLEAVEMVEVRPRVSGYLESIHFTDGAEAKAGELLFVIDPKPYQADLDRAGAERQRAETHVELARNDLKRAEGLRGTRAIAEEEYDSRSKAVREAEAALAGARAAEAAAKLNLDYTRLTAPISGKLGRRLVTVGNLVQGGGMVPGTVLTTIVTMDPLYCYFDADERSFLRYRNAEAGGDGLGQKDGPLLCELALEKAAGFRHTGRIDFFDNQVNKQTGTIPMRAVFANPDRVLVPGLFATVRLPAGPPQQTLLIPDIAVQSDQDRKFVFVVNSTNVVEARPIKIGRADGNLRAVLEGLTVNDRVAVSGLLMLRPGVPVEVQTGAPGAAAPKARAKP